MKGKFFNIEIKGGEILIFLFFIFLFYKFILYLSFENICEFYYLF